MVNRYADQLLSRLGASSSPDDLPHDRLDRLIDAYIAAFSEGKSSCLCAVLGAVNPQLPPAVQDAVQRYFARLLQWVEDAEIPEPAQVISSLQGAMILSVATGDPGHLQQVARVLRGAD